MSTCKTFSVAIQCPCCLEGQTPEAGGVSDTNNDVQHDRQSLLDNHKAYISLHAALNRYYYGYNIMVIIMYYGVSLELNQPSGWLL